MTKLQIRLSSIFFGSVEADLTQNFSSVQRSGQQIKEEISGFDHALAFGASDDQLSVQRKNRRWPICGWVGMDQASANRAAVAHLYVAKMRSRLRQQRTDTAQQIGRLNVVVRSHGANADLSTFLADVREVLDLADIDQHGGLHQTQLHRWNQAMATGQDLGVIFVLSQELQGVIQTFRGNVIELCWDHGVLLCGPC